MVALCSLRRGCAGVLVRALLANADRARDPTLHVWDRAEAAGNSVRNSSGTRHESGVLIAVDMFRSHRLEANTLVLSACFFAAMQFTKTLLALAAVFGAVFQLQGCAASTTAAPGNSSNSTRMLEDAELLA